MPDGAGENDYCSGFGFYSRASFCASEARLRGVMML